MKRLAVVPVLLLLFTAVACSDDSSSDAPDTVAATTGAAGVVLLTPAEGTDLIGLKGEALTIIDVRTPAEFAEGHLEGAVNADVQGGQFSAFLAGLDKGAAYVVYCRSGNRSAVAAQAMIDAGFTEVYDLGGIVDLQAAGYSVVQ
ncbi:MAG: rhodanese-like domain-containing protein [Actinomycetota bacterium]|nr:rhodanese-like domain-containing protein [Actinomycetota bacterium]